MFIKLASCEQRFCHSETSVDYSQSITMLSNLSDCCRRSIEHYKENNSQLAYNLNESRKEVRAMNDVLMHKCREYQEICAENSQLKADLARMETQLGTWKTQIADVVKNNTRGLTQLMAILSATASVTSLDNGKSYFVTLNSMSLSVSENHSNRLFFV